MTKLLRILQILMSHTNENDIDVQGGKVFLSGIDPEKMPTVTLMELYNLGARYNQSLESWEWSP